MSAVKTYPLAIASSAWERRMANWANSRTAVIVAPCCQAALKSSAPTEELPPHKLNA